MKFTRTVEVEIEKLSLDGSANTRLGQEDYYKQYKGGRTDVWCTQFRYEGKFLCNVFFELGGTPPKIDCWETQLDDELRERVLRMAQADFEEGFSKEQRLEHIAFFRRMVREYGIWWKE